MCVLFFAATLGNINERQRFGNSAWRLGCLLPTSIGGLKPVDKIRVFQKAAQLFLQDYNKLLKTGVLVKCSDGNIRNVVIVVTQWQGDQPGVDALCGLVAVSLLCTLYMLCTYCTGF